MSFLFTCREKETYILDVCENKECAWYINCDCFCNCTFVAAHFGPFSYAEMGRMMNLSGEWVRKIEQGALDKLKKKKDKNLLTISLPEPSENIFNDGM